MRTNKEILAVVNQMVSDGQIAQDVAEKYFPELRENKDERMMKIIMNALIKVPYSELDGLIPDTIRIWLEEKIKQGEQNTVVVIPKFRVGDVIRPKGSTAEYTIESISGECYHGKGWGLNIICDDDYELVRHKSASWSKEDKNMLDDIIKILHKYSEKYNGYLDMYYWLLALENRVGCEANCTTTWKPSKEQMVALDGICSYIRNKADWEISQDMVSDLYKLSEQLKKLKGEEQV